MKPRIVRVLLCGALLAPGNAPAAPARVVDILAAAESTWPEAGFEGRINDGSRDHFRIGEQLTFQFTSAAAVYVTLIHVDSRGIVTVLLPSRLDNQVAAHGTLSYPPPGERFFMQAEAPAGLQSLFAFATREPVGLAEVGARPGALATTLDDDAAWTAAARLVSVLRARSAGSVAVVRLDHRIQPASVSAEDIVAGLEGQRHRGIRRPKMDAHIAFPYNSAELGSDAKSALDEFAKALSDASLAGRTFQLNGHTDARGGDTYNLELSLKRAESARKYLLSHAIARERLKVRGFGEAKPLDPAESEEAYQVNRRVEFEMLN